MILFLSINSRSWFYSRETQVRNLFDPIFGFGCSLFNMIGCWEDGDVKDLNFGVFPQFSWQPNRGQYKTQQ